MVSANECRVDATEYALRHAIAPSAERKRFQLVTVFELHSSYTRSQEKMGGRWRTCTTGEPAGRRETGASPRSKLI